MQLGFASAWTREQVIGTLPLLGPVETLGVQNGTGHEVVIDQEADGVRDVLGLTW